MEIGTEEEETITVEPLVDPVRTPEREREREPEHEPEPEPVKQVADIVPLMSPI
jgi:hypothetical protein